MNHGGKPMLKRILLLMLALSLTGPALAQTKKRIEKAADLPRFTYQVDGKVEDLLTDDAKFATFARQLRRDIDSVLAGYEIPDKASERQLLGTLTQLDVLEGRYADALARSDQITALQEKPADKLLSGMQLRAMLAARQEAGGFGSEAYKKDVGQRIRTALDSMPFQVIENDVKSAKSRADIASPALVIGSIREQIQPTVDKTGSLSSDQAPGVVNAKYYLTYTVPLKQTLIDTYGGYLVENKVEKQDIWAARDVTLPAGRGYADVPVAVWDSGVDTALFGDRVVMEGGKPVLIAFDKYSNPSAAGLLPIPAELKDRVPKMKARLKGFSDLQANIESPEATEVKQWLSTLQPDAYKAAIEEINLAGIYVHGTHVAGIAMAGNPYARLVNARIEFQHTLLPNPCPTRELVEKEARATQGYIGFMRTHGVRVVNMSFGGSVGDLESALEQCGIGNTPDERKAIAREYFEIGRKALEMAMLSATEILFVAAGGNSNDDASFTESIPAAISAPNLLSVGAVDKAGEEASFTSYGPTIVVHANGYQVDSVIPGGEKLAASGTSMAAPQVTNLAAKLLAVNPKLTPVQLIAIIRDTADKTADGRRTLIHPAKALAAVQ
jgi:subtilisin family serine protease